MKKIIAALFMAAVLAITATGCMGASNTANDKATGDEAKSHRAEDYTNDLEGLCNYFASFGYINPQAPSTIMSMDAALIGAVEGNRYVGYKNEQSDYTYLTIELYQYDTSKENATADEIVAAARPNTRALFAETLTNPSVCVLNFEAYSEAAKRLGVPLIVDNTFATPYLCRPFDFGADIVTHSATKYLDGHQTSIGGVIVEKGDFNWSNGNFPEFTEPDVSYHGLVYTKDFPAAPFSTKLRVQWVRDSGAILPPMNAFLINLGMQTLHLRMDRHSENALEMAKFLKAHPKVAWVNYPGLEDSPEHERCKKYLRAASGVLCFGAVGGKEASVRAIDSLKLASIVVHVADVRTMVLHPASMTHRQLSDEQLAAAGVPPDLIRLSVGIENIDDIKADFEQALAKI